MKNLLLAAIAALLLTACGRQDGEVLYLYNWSEYLPQEVLDRFTLETGIRVNYTTYDSNEAMYARIRLLDERHSYDLVVPSTYYVSKMGREALLQPIDHAALTNLQQLDPALMDQGFDPGNRYSIPYLWGTTGLAYNAERVAGEQVVAWSDLWREEFAGRVLLTDDMREVFHIALHTLGYSGNTTDEGEIAEAYERLRDLMPSVRAFNSDAPRMPYLEGEVDVGMIWNGEAVMAAEDLPALTYVYPLDGVIIWMDSFVIPRNARNPEAAHRFIDFVLRPDIAAAISEEIGYASPNLGALELLPDEVVENRAQYPTPQDLENGEFQEDVGDALLIYDRYWQRLKAGR